MKYTFFSSSLTKKHVFQDLGCFMKRKHTSIKAGGAQVNFNKKTLLLRYTFVQASIFWKLYAQTSFHQCSNKRPAQ